MPRADTPSSRSRRSARRTKAAPTKRPDTAKPSETSGGEGEDVKGEPKETIFDDSQPTIPPPEKSPPVLPNKRRPWKHSDELEYIKPHDWDEDQIIGYLCKNGFSVPARLSHAQSPWCEVTDCNGDVIIIPRGYRLPLMFAAKFQWESLRLVMTSASRDEEWDDYKFDILHVSRLCRGFLDKAKAAMGAAGMDRSWRCSMFDRALTRYYRRWLVNREEFVRDFWLEYGEEEYERDILKGDWTRFVQKGHKGFSLTRNELNNGITFDAFTRGLSFIGGRLNWETNHNLGDKQNPSQAAETTPDKPELLQLHLELDNAHKNSTTDEKNVCLLPATIAIKLEQIVDDPNFLRQALSPDRQPIHIASTPDYEPPPPIDTDMHNDDATTTLKPVDVELSCTRVNEHDEFYTSLLSTKAATIVPTADESVPQTSEENIAGHEPTVVAQHPEPVVDSVSSADVVIPDADPDTNIMAGSGVSVDNPPVISSPDIEMASADETSPPEEDKSTEKDLHPDPVDHDSAPPAQETSSPQTTPTGPPEQTSTSPPSPQVPVFSGPADMDPTPSTSGSTKSTVRTVSAEPQQTEPASLPDVEMSPPTSQPARSQSLSGSSQTSSRRTKSASEQPSSPEKKLSAWDTRIHAAMQRFTKPVRPTLSEKGAASVDEPALSPSAEVGPRANSDSMQGPVEPPRQEVTPRALSPLPSGSTTVAPASDISTISQESSIGTLSEVAAGKARQLDPEPSAEEGQESVRGGRRSAELEKEPTPPMEVDMDMELDMDVESRSVSQTPRAQSRSPESSEHAFIDPRESLSSASTYRRHPLPDAGLQSGYDNSPMRRQVESIFRETFFGVLDSLERGDTISPTVNSQQIISTSVSASVSASSLADSSIVNELLDEIRSLKRQLQKDADHRMDLQSQVDDLRRQVDSQSRMSVDVEDEANLPESPSTSYSMSPQVRRRRVDSDLGPVLSSHPLAHLLAMDLDDLPPADSETATANASPWSTPDISTPPCPKPPTPHGAAPLPIKSQRKHRMMFFPPSKQL